MRQLLLTTALRLVYIELETMEVKGDVTLVDETRVVTKVRSHSTHVI